METHPILTTCSEDETARTTSEIAIIRANHLACLGIKSVLELCVGPSLQTLHEAYRQCNIEVYGNDIDPRWQRYWPDGKWIIGDALSIPWAADAIVFAPPLSRGCTGRREDALRISQVNPAYTRFIKEWADRGPSIAVMVLPARSWATPQDRSEYHGLLTFARRFGRISPIEMSAGVRRIRKYVDIYMEKER